VAGALEDRHQVLVVPRALPHAPAAVAKRGSGELLRQLERTATSILTTAADAYFSSELMPLAYRVWYLAPTSGDPSPTVGNCHQGGPPPFAEAPATAWLQFRGDFDPGDGPVAGGLWALGTYQGLLAPPPAELTDAMFLSTAQSGYGIQLPRFLRSQYEAPPRRYWCT
jgi:hypothetical protein